MSSCTCTWLSWENYRSSHSKRKFIKTRFDYHNNNKVGHDYEGLPFYTSIIVLHEYAHRKSYQIGYFILQCKCNLYHGRVGGGSGWNYVCIYFCEGLMVYICGEEDSPCILWRKYFQSRYLYSLAWLLSQTLFKGVCFQHYIYIREYISAIVYVVKSFLVLKVFDITFFHSWGGNGSNL